MANDKLFSKRKAASISKRKNAHREPYPRVLIVCEDSVSAPNYFNYLVDYFRINTANIVIYGEQCGSDPSSIFTYAKDIFNEEKLKGNPFDAVYTVFDRDQHHLFTQVVNEIRSFSPKNTFFATYSIPCFEFWLLIHFVKTTQPFVKPRSGKKCSDDVIKQLNSHLKSSGMAKYTKGSKIDNEIFINNLDVAIDNAKKIHSNAIAIDSENPITYLYQLVEKLKNLKKETV